MNIKLEHMPEAYLADVFRYHAPTEEQQVTYAGLRRAGAQFAAVILDTVPACEDRTAALDKVREAVMRANAAVALEGKI